MRRQSTMRAALGRLWRSERGFALPAVLMIVVAGLGLGSAAVVASINTQSGSVRDEKAKDALAAAEAGVELAFYRQNKIATTSAQPCVVPGAGGALVPGSAAADGWCPAWTGTVGARTYTYRVKPWALVGTAQTGYKRQVSIVSVGNADSVSRRVDVVASADDGGYVFGSSSVIGRNSITMNSNARVDGNAGSNGDITLNSNAVLCGAASVGVGESLTLNGNAQQCSGYGTQQTELNLPPVVLGDVATNNSNGRFFSQDIKSGHPVTYDATTKTLTLDSNATLTMGGTNYYLCKLVLKSNSIIFVAAGADIRVFFDSPEACGQASGTTQMEMSSNTRILTTDHDPTSVAFLFVGSDTRTTWVKLDSNTAVDPNCDQSFVIYGPRSQIQLNSNSKFCGAIAGKTLHLDSNARVVADARTQNFTLPTEIVYSRDRYVECTGGAMPTGAGTDPDDYC